MNLEDLRDRKPRTRLFVAASGAGAGLQQTLWSVPGASSFLVGAAFPYAEQATNAFLGFKPEKYCSEDTAIELAMAAFVRACEGSTGDDEPVGVGLTAVVTSQKEHRGEHRIHVATMRAEGVKVATRTLPKSTTELVSSRRFDEGSAADYLGVSAVLDSGWMTDVPESRLRSIFFRRPVFRLSGIRETAAAIDSTDAVFLAGTFNPLHDGHRGMARSVARMVPGARVMYSVTASPVHKPQLSTAQMLRLVAHLRSDRWIGQERDFVFSDGDPLYIDKARRYPGAAFAIGVDAVLRMLDPKWGPNVPAMLSEFRSLGTRFYVFGREVDGKHVGPLDFDCCGFPELFVPMRGSWPVSSSELRRAG